MRNVHQLMKGTRMNHNTNWSTWKKLRNMESSSKRYTMETGRRNNSAEVIYLFVDTITSDRWNGILPDLIRKSFLTGGKAISLEFRLRKMLDHILHMFAYIDCISPLHVIFATVDRISELWFPLWSPNRIFKFPTC